MPTPTDLLNMSDEEFTKLGSPPEPEASEPEPKSDPAPEPKPEEPAAPEEDPEPKEEPPAEDLEPAPVEGEPEPEEPASPGSKPEADPEPKGEEPKAGDPVEPEPKTQDSEEPEPEPKGKDEKDKDEDSKTSEYESFYKRVMAPFKANGKTIQVESVDEVIALMQMGANYTKKMQSIQRDKKFLLMLEQNGLLDENKLSFYIDLEKKNPDAIKKFLKDTNVDPVDIDTSGEVNYKSGSHTVTDQEVNLHTAIEDLNSMEGGKETLQSINDTWDPASKKALWDNPQLLAIIHAQRGNGIYARISGEIDRRKVLGQVGPNEPFLQAYKTIGDELAARGALPGIKPAPSGQPPVTARTPVAVRPARTPATKAAESAKVKAAAAPRTVSRPAKSSVNFLAMSDDEFMKISNKVS